MSQEGLFVGNIQPIDLEDEIQRSYLDYSMSVIVGRALPDVRDGLKPVHKRILWAMLEAGYRPDRPHRKCAAVIGDVLKKYHPHGDQSVYDALVRMAQDWSLRYPLVDGHGNFGSIDGDPAAAYRYQGRHPNRRDAGCSPRTSASSGCKQASSDKISQRSRRTPRSSRIACRSSLRISFRRCPRPPTPWLTSRRGSLSSAGSRAARSRRIRRSRRESSWSRLSTGRTTTQTVASIEDAGRQPVYSLRVDSDDHSFITNGLSHNTEAVSRHRHGAAA